MHARIVAGAAVLVLLAPGVARADGPTFGITLSASIGTHAEAHTRQRIPTVPFPVFDVRVPLHRFEIDAEGVPPIGPVGYNSHSAYAIRGTKLSYLMGEVRYRFPKTRWSAGIGEMLYNQETVYDATRFGSTDTLVDTSRVGGARYELGYEAFHTPVRSLAFSAAVAPAMHATVYEVQTVVSGPFRMSFGEQGPETGSQVEAQALYGIKARAMTWTAGLRYVNYIAHFDFSGQLSDRNSLLLPFVGVRMPIGSGR